MQGVIIININELKTMPIRELEGPLKEKFIVLKVITGYQYDGGKLLMESNGNPFSILFHREQCNYGSIRHKELLLERRKR